VGDEKAGDVVRPRGQTLVALAVLGVVAFGGLIAQWAGVREATALTPRVATSGAWFCPHGGGGHWTASIYVANPGSQPVTVRARSLGEGRPRDLRETTVQPGTSEEIPAPAAGPANATSVEYFGGWVAASWVARADGKEVGVAAEPCLPGADRHWTLADGSTEQGESAYVVVMNPFAADAVFDVTALTDSDPPKAITDFSDYVLAGGRSAAFKLNQLVLGEAAVAARVDVSIGRVAVATLGITSRVGIRSSVGWPGAPGDGAILPGGGDAGASVLVAADPGVAPSTFSASVLGPKGLQVAGRLRQQTQEGASATAYPVTTGDPSSISAAAQAGDPGVVLARRTRGETQDLGSTGGVAAAGGAWIVPPATGSAPRSPVLYLTNPGERPVEVSLETLPVNGSAASARTTIPPGGTIAAPKRLFSGKGDHPVMARAENGTFAPAAASYSQGQHGVAGYAVSTGIPIPNAWLPRGK
jgi:hypothetical protein